MLAALFADRPLPRSAPGRIALAGMALLAAWTTVSMAWSPISSAALDDAQRAILYLGALIAAAAFLTPGRSARALEPALAAGALLIACYGLSERLLPSLVELDRSESAAARLEQPLTYWNAMGVVAAIGLVLAARLVGDRSRPLWMRCTAAAASAPLGAGGLPDLLARGARGTDGGARPAGAAAAAARPADRDRPHARLAPCSRPCSSGSSPGSGDWRTAAAAACRGSWRSCCSRARRRGQSLIARRLAAAEPAPAQDVVAPRRTVLGLAVVAVVVIGIAVAATNEARPDLRRPATGATPSRLVSVDSNRYQYWRVALDVFGEHPLVGAGAGAFRVEWLKRRTVDESVVDAHSLVIETAAELGLVGLAALALLLGGSAVAARRAYRAAPELAAGPTAVIAVWMTHSLLDWDWEMPAVTLIALACAGALVAAADRAAAPRVTRRRREPAAPAGAAH